MSLIQKYVKEISVDNDYDLPYAIAYGKITWFLWMPTDATHREWKKINEDLVVKQTSRGKKISIQHNNNYKKNEVEEKLGLWYDHEDLLKNQPHEIRFLFRNYPIRFPKASIDDFELLFTAAVLSPQVSWEENTTWTQLLYFTFKHNFLKIADIDPPELDHILRETSERVILTTKPNLRKLGYHAKVLVNAFQDYKDKFGGDARKIYDMTPQEALLSYMKIYGFGPKIAMFLIQATHGDFSLPCVDRHVFRTANNIGLIKTCTIPYNANMCKSHITNCVLCPHQENCATHQLMRFNASGLISSLLYFSDIS